MSIFTHSFFAVALVPLLCASCGGAGRGGAAAESPGRHALDGYRAPTAEGPRGELLSGELGSGSPESWSEGEIPENADRQQLLAAGRRALEEGRVDEAVSIADVLVVLDSEDAESLELRARCLKRAGDSEAAREDLERCCDLGRESCCDGG
ncbi:MAG: tetratricopeptide repeat protein [Polyangia bacterium]